MKVAVIGAGKMGLPIACQLASRGASVRACDISALLVAMINAGHCPFEEPGLEVLLPQAVAGGRLSATTDVAGAVRASDVVIVIVPVLLTQDRRADLRHIEAVAAIIGDNVPPGAMVIFETTLPVGATRKLLPLLERGGRRAGLDLDLVFSPERVKSQRVFKHLTEHPKIVGGLTPSAGERAADFYKTFLGAPVIDVGSLEAAELVKLAGMVYRDVNIALANELARYADAVNADFRSIAAAANTDGEAYLLGPGIGVGGHCTPVYPHFLIKDAQERGIGVSLTELSRQINDEQPAEAIARVEAAWGPLQGRRVQILGLGFRPEVKEHTCSPAFAVQTELLARGATVTLCDPLYTPDEIRAHGFVPGSLDDVPAPEVVVLVTAHQAFTQLDFTSMVENGLRAVVDGRNVWDANQVTAAGSVYVGIGCGDIGQPLAEGIA